MYVVLIMKSENLWSSIYLSTTVGGVVEVVAYLLAQKFMRHRWLGRRVMLAVSFLLGSVSLLLTRAVPAGQKHLHFFRSKQKRLAILSSSERTKDLQIEFCCRK